jgi:hypothetical protein
MKNCEQTDGTVLARLQQDADRRERERARSQTLVDPPCRDIPLFGYPGIFGCCRLGHSAGSAHGARMTPIPAVSRTMQMQCSTA